VEAGLQTRPITVLAGEVDSIQTKVESYHRKADQAENTKKFLLDIARRYDLPVPKRVSSLVVTDVPVPITPALHDELWRQRPNRHPMFMSSVEDFERLVATASVASIPALVADWQAQGKKESVFYYLWRMARWIPFDGPELAHDAASWARLQGAKFAA
jgi:hypothetical protein